MQITRQAISINVTAINSTISILPFSASHSDYNIGFSIFKNYLSLFDIFFHYINLSKNEPAKKTAGILPAVS